MIILPFVLLILLTYVFGQQTEQEKTIETTILKGYNSKHRPVKKDSTTVNVNVYMAIHHIEKIVSLRKTHLQKFQITGRIRTNDDGAWKLVGNMVSSNSYFCQEGLIYRMDEYLVWDPKEWNNTYKVAIDTWKIWQPALSLYNRYRNSSGSGK